MNYRNLRVGNLIQEELSHLILRELEFPGALVTITNVAVDEKLENAKIRVSILPPEKEKDVLKILVDAQGKFQHLLSHKLNIKPMPRIQFEIDRGEENAAHVEKLILDNEEKRD